MRLRVITTLSFLLIACAVPTAAMAQDATTKGYDESGVLGELQTGGGDANTTVQGGEDAGTQGAGEGGVLGESDAGGVAGTQGARGAGAEGAGAAPRDTESLSGGSLPFTGLDVALIAILGIGLVGLGLMLRRTGRRGDLTA